MANENEQPEDVQQLQDAASRQPQPDTGFMQQFQQPAPGGWGQEPDRAYLQSPQPDGPPVDEYQAAQARQNRQRQLQAYEEQRQAYADYLDRWNGNQGLLNGRAGRTSLNANNDIGDSGFTPSFPGQTRPGSPLIPGDARDDFVGIRPEVRPPSPIGGGRDAQQPGLSRYAVRMDDGTVRYEYREPQPLTPQQAQQLRLHQDLSRGTPQQQAAALHTYEQSRLLDIQLGARERERMGRMTDAIAGINANPNLDQPTRNDLIMQIRTELDPMRHRLQEENVLTARIHRRQQEEQINWQTQGIDSHLRTLTLPGGAQIQVYMNARGEPQVLDTARQQETHQVMMDEHRARTAAIQAQAAFAARPLNERISVAYHPDSRVAAERTIDNWIQEQDLPEGTITPQDRQYWIDQELRQSGHGTVMFETQPGHVVPMGNRSPGAPTWTPQLEQNVVQQEQRRVSDEYRAYREAQNRARAAISRAHSTADREVATANLQAIVRPPWLRGDPVAQGFRSMLEPLVGPQELTDREIEQSQQAEIRAGVARRRQATEANARGGVGGLPPAPGATGGGASQPPAPGSPPAVQPGLEAAARDFGLQNFIPPVQRQDRFADLRAANAEQRRILGGLAPDFAADADAERRAVERGVTRLEMMIQEHGPTDQMTQSQRRAYNGILHDIARSIRTHRWPLPSSSTTPEVVQRHLLQE